VLEGGGTVTSLAIDGCTAVLDDSVGRDTAGAGNLACVTVSVGDGILASPDSDACVESAVDCRGCGKAGAARIGGKYPSDL
jgi:hypothetical protein